MRLPKETQIEDSVRGTHHRRASLIIAIPTLGMVPIEFVVGFSRLQMPVNGSAESFVVIGMEVGKARNHVVEQILQKPIESQPRYIFFIGDDMIAPWDGLIRLHEEAEKGGWDCLTGLYYWKGEPPTPLAWRDDHVGRMLPGRHFGVGEVVWVDVTGMDFTLLRTETLRKIEPPWFQTGPGHVSGLAGGTGEGVVVYTEDVFFCKKLKQVGGTVGVHSGVRVGHLDIKTGMVY